MDIRKLDLNLLVVLEAIHAEGNLTRAAHRLHLSQPALSHALARLRVALDDPLFIRLGNRMVPTPRTQRLMGPLHEALGLITEGIQEGARFDAASSRQEFTLGLRDVFEATALPGLLTVMAREAPDVRLASVRVDRRELESDLVDGRLDVALDVLLPLSDDIRRAPASQDRLIVVARAGHPGIQRSRLSIESYLAAQHVLVSSRRRGPGFEDQELARLGHRRQIVLRCQHYFAACRVVAETDYLLTMPAQYAALANAGLGNRLLEMPVPIPAMDVYLYWHESRETDPANRWLRERLLKLFANRRA
ncbi:LysR family transcriptional regulator [Pseudomonas sp.]|uniref:LysR family transcriptional regulator n=1 Tax=Pseudomonas sp. TaxID=306 RepID=UPI0027303F59|nr:LysR family transcriptional regulator [Pseudomonas sp.]MDP2245760.1 LysR family transcriptional regulator [Pseudomonas sp.]